VIECIQVAAVNDDSEQVRVALRAHKRRIEQESQAAAEARDPVALDQQAVGRLSRIDAFQAQQMAEAQERRRKVQLVRIEMALRRLEAGEYGYCVSCGKEIAPRRLEVDPLAERCIDCA
jgi:RNA polymerase-binding transcription factor